MSLVETSGDGLDVFEGTPGEHAHRPTGRVHGPFAATVLDSACACTAHSRLAADRGCKTLELSAKA